MSIIRKEQLSNPLSASYALTASYVANTSTNIDTSGLVTTSSFNAFTSSINTFTSSYNTGSFSGSFTGSLNGTTATASYYQETDPIFVAKSASFATTGSNTFIGNQTVTGSLNLTGSFNHIGDYVHTGSVNHNGDKFLVGVFSQTGSMNITGSTTQIGTNRLLGNTILSGSIIISGSTTTPTTPTIQIYGDMETDGVIKFMPVGKNIDTSISASYIYVSGSTNDLYFSQNGSGYNNITRLRWLEGNLYTGLLHGGAVTQVNSNTYQVASGSGIIVNLNASLTDDPYPTIQFLEWNNLTKTIDALSASYDQQFIAINSSNEIYAQGTPFSNGQIDTYIPIGMVFHQNHSTINGTKTQPSLGYGWKQRSNVFISAFGPLKLSGHALLPSSSLGLNIGSGTSFADGADYSTDPNSPSYVVDPGTNISKIFRYYQSGSEFVYNTNNGAGYIDVDFTKYNLNGSGSLVNTSGGKYYAQRIFWYPNSVTKAMVAYYGLKEYNSLDEAQRDYILESFVEAPNTQQNAIFVGTILLRGNGSFATPSDYRILQAGLFRSITPGGGGGVGATTLAELTDVSIPLAVYGDLLMKDGSVWINTKQLSGSYSLTGSLTATSFTGSLFGTSSWAQSASQAITASRATTSSFALTASYALSGGSGGSGSPGGGDTTIQFNDSTAFNGSSNFTFNKNTNLVNIQKAGSQNVFPPIIESTTSSLAINGNINVLGKIQTNEANIYTQTFPPIQTLPFDKNVEWDIGKSGSIALITLSDNATDFEINYFGDLLGYAKGTLIVRQDSTGGWSFPLPTSMGGGSVSNYVENNGGGTYNPTPDPNAYDILEFVCINKAIFWSIKYNFT